MMADSELASTSPSTKAVANVETTGEATAIIAETDLVTVLQQLLQDHELDQNFPQDILNRIRDFLDRQKSHDLATDLELARTLFEDYHEQRNLALNHSAYPEVRAVVDPTDDPTLPVATFRVFLLGTVFTVAGTAIQQFFSFRMPAINITTYVVQLLSMLLGVGMAKWLPCRQLAIKQWNFSLNPGRFNEKEHLLIAVMANVAFAGYMHGAYIASPIQVLSLDLFYGEKVLSNNWNVSTYFGDPIVTPLFTLVNYASGMAFMGFIIAPIVYFKNAWHSGYLPINTNKVYDDSASLYDIRRILNANMTLNEEKYLAYSIPWLSSNQILKLGSFVMIYVAVPMQMLLWHRKQITQSLRSIWDRKTREEDFNDVHNRLMREYDKCPDWWYLIVIGISFGLACISVTIWPTGMPVWGVLLAVLFTILLQIPIGMLTAITNIELPTSILSLLIGGYALEGKALPNMIFTLYSYMSTSQAMNFVADLKMAHYAKLPPRVVFAAQIYATLIAALVAFAVNRWSYLGLSDATKVIETRRYKSNKRWKINPKKPE
ncbi:hypothetical protein ACSS6W_004124 [Trichoderma asperelloides]